MTIKDLNLSLDQTYFQQKVPVSPGPETVNTNPRPESVAANSASTTAAVHAAPTQRRPRVPGAAPSPGKSREWLVVSGIAVVNMLFLVLAAIWLSGNPSQSTAPYTPQQITTPPALLSSLARINGQLDSMAQQLVSVQQSVEQHQQQQQMALEKLVLAQQLPELPATKENPDTADTTREAHEQAQQWHVNLGDFGNAEAARTAQQRVAATGHEAEISSTTAGGSTRFLVSLRGFSDRESAELAASQIMSQTNLNGLWVGEGN